MTAEQEARMFSLWEYKHDHSLILIRSQRSKQNPTNLDVIFYGILYIEIPQFLNSDPKIHFTLAVSSCVVSTNRRPSRRNWGISMYRIP